MSLGVTPRASISAPQFGTNRWVDKIDLAVVHGVSARTIDNWMAEGRVPFRKLPGGMVRFRLDRVEGALAPGDVEGLLSPVPSPAEAIPASETPQWGDKRALAAIYAVSVRTIEAWMAGGVIPFRRLSTGRVRFDLRSVERVLANFDISGGRR